MERTRPNDPETLPSAEAAPATQAWPPTGSLPATPSGFPGPFAEPAVPQRIGDYAIVAVIDQGGMGVVYHARSLLGQDVAIKMNLGQDCSDATLKRFFAEAKTMAEVKHPHLVSILHYGVHEGRPYFVMPKYAGTLADRKKDYQLQPERALPLMIRVAQGVGCLHQRGITHRDLKPKNILFDGESPVVGDFGLIKWPSQGDSAPGAQEGNLPAGAGASPTLASPLGQDYTKQGTVLGTPNYMCPEQKQGEVTQVNPTWDVYSLGVIFHELICGVRPEEGQKGVSAEKIQAEPRQALAGVLTRCLSPCREGRFPDGNALAAELLSVQGMSQRWSTKKRLTWVILSVLLIFLIFAIFTKSGDPEKHARTKLNQYLQTGKKVILIGPKDRPAYLRFHEGEDDANLRNWLSDGAFTIDTPTVALVELIPPRACPQGFRFGAQVRVNSGQLPQSRGGLYHGHAVQQEAPGKRHVFAEFAFSEHGFMPLPAAGQGRPARKGKVAYELRQWAPPPAQPVANHSLTLIHLATEAKWLDLGEEEPWRNLEALITPAQVQLDWEGWRLGTENMEKMTKDFAGFLQRQPPPAANAPLSFGPERGLGLFVFQASVSFRSVWIEPLPPGPD